MRLFGKRIQGETAKTLTCLIEKKIEFDFVDLTRAILPDKYPDHVLKLSPSGDLPVLQHERWILTGSHAICFYIDGLIGTPLLYPLSARERGIVNYLEEIYYRYLGDVTQNISRQQSGEASTRPETVLAIFENRLVPLLNIFEHYLSETKYLTGDVISIADISLACSLQWLSRRFWTNAKENADENSVYGEVEKEFPCIERLCDELWVRQSFQSVRDLGSTGGFKLPVTRVDRNGSLTTPYEFQ